MSNSTIYYSQWFKQVTDSNGNQIGEPYGFSLCRDLVFFNLFVSRFKATHNEFEVVHSIPEKAHSVPAELLKQLEVTETIHVLNKNKRYKCSTNSKFELAIVDKECQLVA